MKKRWTIFLLLLVLTACSEEPNRMVYPENDSIELTHLLDNNDSVVGYKSVMDEKSLLVVIDIPRIKRFNKAKIEEKLQKQVEEKFPGKEVIVSGDMKIKWEIEKIMKSKIKDDELTKSIDKIKSLSKEET